MFIHIPGKAGRLPFEAPLSMCCNCGSERNLILVDTPLKKTRFLLLAGTEITFLIELPYCEACTKTAKRIPPGIFHKLLVAALIFIVLLIAVAFAEIDLSAIIPAGYVTHAVGLLSLVASFSFFAVRRGKPPQTSYAQPVTLTGLKQEFLGSIVSLSFGFSNETYATRFESLNSAYVSSGALKIVHR